MNRRAAYTLRRYHLTLSTFAGIVPGASHVWCRIRWKNNDGTNAEVDAERGRGESRTARFDNEADARAAGLRLVRRIADGYYIVTEGSASVLDPQRVLSAPGNLGPRLNKLWHQFEKLNGWGAPKSAWPDVQRISDAWERLIGGAT